MTTPIAITLGDPAGVGPEIVAKVLDAHADEPLVAIGHRRAIDDLRLALRHPVVSAGDPAAWRPGAITIVEPPQAYRAPAVGAPGAAGGAMALAYLDAAIDLARAGRVAAMVTAPISKEAVNLTGLPFTGHTEHIAEALGVLGRERMLLVTDRLRVVHVTTHRALASVSAALTTERVLDTIRAADSAVRLLGDERRRIAVAGFNPHAGEGGLFGDEEGRAIAPAVEAARREGIDASGPWPPDTIFARAFAGEFEAVVAMYHDQGHIPAKLLGIELGINVTLGVPIIRTSVDHGTAYDIAGRGIARTESLERALAVARRMAAHRAA
ncbi:MAG TPA: 4-hydroxythreonine-4-phosphate dehydrogenase PdxA [Candidatus Dormibacteraeota bacterium]|nr:4-hydroxythreonine-4-phosphate dehydrogenase PdxA [Candidatus Dormibacteraeota bacterium]